MKIEENVISIMREMLAEPEKDWSNHLPLIRLSEEDFTKAKYLVRKHCQNANKREEVMKSLERWIEKYETGGFWRQEYLKDFVWFLKKEIGKNKTWDTKTKIEEEINELLDTEKNYELENMFEPYEVMFNHLKDIKMFQGQFQNKHKELLETFDSKEAKISEFLVEQN